MAVESGKGVIRLWEVLLLVEYRWCVVEYISILKSINMILDALDP